MFCSSCSSQYKIVGRLEFRARCTECDNPLHSCVNCNFFDEGAYNKCRENKAERVVEKVRENRCEYFQPAAEKKQTTSDKNPTQTFDDLFS